MLIFSTSSCRGQGDSPETPEWPASGCGGGGSARGLWAPSFCHPRLGGGSSTPSSPLRLLRGRGGALRGGSLASESIAGHGRWSHGRHHTVVVFLGLAVRPDAPTPHWGAGCGVPSWWPAFAPVDEEDSGAPAPSPGPTRPAWGSREERGPSKVILPHQPQAGPGGGGPGERGSRRGGPLVSREEPRRGAAGPRGHGLSTQKCSTPKTCAFSV